MKHKYVLLAAGLLVTVQLAGCSLSSEITPTVESYDLESIPPYTDEPYVVLQENVPDFDSSDFTTQAFETYAPLDELDRCGVAYANICTELMPTEERGSIGQVKIGRAHV